ncbi:MAG: hypothetical protein IJE25_03690 [Clostridia bacterium]|nr:hypothetical protein [Clostridia bacterium]
MIFDNSTLTLAKERAMEHDSLGIGGLSERTLHKTLKLCFEPREEHHEREYLGMVVDILNENGVTEIQTRSLEKLDKKLSRLLPEMKVDLVYPIAVKRWMAWVDPESGDVSEPRRIPRRGRAADALLELYRISKHLENENLTVTLVLLNTLEYKEKNGVGKDKKKWATRLERIPTELVDIITLKNKHDYFRLIPESLGKSFTASEFYKAAAFRTRRAYYALMLLCELGVLSREKAGRAYLYSKNQ